MIDIDKLRDFINGNLADSGNYLVDVKVSGDNNIVVEIDNDEAVDIDDCVRLTRAIEEAFDRDVEDYELEVGSCGLTAPFKVERQYHKNIGNPIEVLTADGRKLHGVLSSADADGFTMKIEEKVKAEGEKRPHIEEVEHRFSYGDVKRVVYDMQF
ncbi:MAG: ribosome assembly cofactor RimP [Bacteroidales bacterium]|nr:ribosome assembly cofactor RimP [Bacteroidales bacterium]